MLNLIYVLTVFYFQIQESSEYTGKNRKCTIGEIKHANLDQADCFDKSFRLLYLVVIFSRLFCFDSQIFTSLTKVLLSILHAHKLIMLNGV